MALYAQGTTTLRNIASWRVKETDRIAAMATRGAQAGCRGEEGRTSFASRRRHRRTIGAAASVHTYDDHRVAMCFSLAAFNPAGLPVRIEDPQCVAKTFPDYFEALFSAGARPARPHRCICIDGPTAWGKGTRGRAGGPAPGLCPARLRRALSHRRAGRPAAPALLDQRPTPQHIADLGWRSWTSVSAKTSACCSGEDISVAIRTGRSRHECLTLGLSAVRRRCWQLQREFRRLPGLVADGRDMGTVVFPDAPLEGLLDAPAPMPRRTALKQLISKGSFC